MTPKMQKGYALLNQLHGEHSGEKLMEALKDICPEYVDMTAEFAFGELFAREALDFKTRELMIISLCTALGDMPNQLKAHTEAALRCGATKAECVESILQALAYAGFARVTNAFLAVKDCF